jgi:RNA polymerase sigma-70 factor (ECF subfamily)
LQASSKLLYQELELINLLKQKDRQSFSTLYDCYSPALFGVILKIVKIEEVARDVMQESFVKIWKKIDSYDREKGTLFTWILNISRNTAIDKIRSADYRHSQQTSDINDEVTKTQPSTQTPIEHIGLDTLVKSLRIEYQEVINIIYFKGHTHTEAAEALSIPLGTLKTRVKAALQELRKLTYDFG